MVYLKTLLFTVLVPGTATVVLPWLVLAATGGPRDPGPLRLLGLVPGLAGLLVYLWCAWDFAAARGTPAPIDPPKQLVVRGLYRFSRNPMYLGVLALLLGEALFFGSPALLAYALALLAAFHLFVVLYEEPTLGRLFGDAYRRYTEAVPRWLPRPTRRRERAAS